MKQQSFTTSILVDQTPEQCTSTILNVRDWWSGLFNESFEGKAGKNGDEFTFKAGDGAHYTKQKLVELIPGKKIEWLVTESNLTFVPKTDEWTGTRIRFELTKEKEKTRITFTHDGLNPGFQCYDSCSPVWTRYIQEQLPKALSSAKNQKV